MRRHDHISLFFITRCPNIYSNRNFTSNILQQSHYLSLFKIKQLKNFSFNNVPTNFTKQRLNKTHQTPKPFILNKPQIKLMHDYHSWYFLSSKCFIKCSRIKCWNCWSFSIFFLVELRCLTRARSWSWFLYPFGTPINMV